jgi:outer membrane biosynthesis protein TonB
MSWKLTNVSLNPSYAMKRRTASRMEMEPVIGEGRIRLNQSVEISDEAYEVNKAKITLCVNHGVLTAVSSTPAVKAPVVKRVEVLPPPPAPEPESEPAPEPKPEPEPKPVETKKKSKSKRGKK